MSEVKEIKKRIDFLDYLKAICVIMVIITHYDWADKDSPFFTMLINMAVPVFMIISGYNFAMSNRKKTGGNLKKMYAWEMIKPKLIRFLVPFFTVCLIEIVLLVIEDKHINPPRIFLLGAYGPGSYYVPIMIQLLVIFPIIYKLVEKNARLGIALSGAANLLFEIGVKIFDMDKYYYRLNIGRYLLLIAFGCYLYLYPEHRVKKYQLISMFLIGLGYIVAVFGFNWDIILFGYWKTTAMPIAFYIFPIIILLCSLLPLTTLQKSDLLKAVSEVMPSPIVPMMSSLIESLYNSTVGVTSIAAIVTVWSASKGMLSIMRGLNAMNGVVEDRNYFVQRILASFYTILLLIVLLLSLVFMVFGTTLVRLLNDRIPILDHLMSVAMHFKPLFSWGILTLVFMVIYAYVPNVKLKLTKQFPGALFTAISWNLFSWGFSAYIEQVNDFGVYGSLSTIVVVMMWLYFCMYLLLVGAHINRFAVPFRREILEK